MRKIILLDNCTDIKFEEVLFFGISDLCYIGFPLLGDEKYLKVEIQKQLVKEEVSLESIKNNKRNVLTNTKMLKSFLEEKFND